MRTASRRITRKEIRQPDRFVVLARRAIAFSKANQTAVAAGIAGVVVLLVLVLGWNLYRSRQNRLAAEEYARAIDLYHESRYKEALEALNRLEVYRSSYYSRMGLLYAASTQNALQNTTAAVDSLQRLLQEEKKDPLLRQSAYVSLGYTQEQRGQWADAARSYTEAEKIAGPLKADALLGEARTHAQAGNLKEAVAAYKKFLADNPDSERFNEVSVRAQELEAKARQAAPAK
ncbi:MAG TPA: tetratricopeptide repeat protein [Verrucomicrobiae bacterium]|nr:tetratricopeptide repeat protein [Verrucomicrobiae bacterium]